MEQQYFEPWIGNDYLADRTLLISESTYDWTSAEGDICTPQPDHASGSVQYQMKNLGQNTFFTSVNRALCGRKDPTLAEMESEWAKLAYTIFVRKTVGLGAGVRPSSDQWRVAASLLLPLLEQLRPRRVIITGLDMWNRMPDTQMQLSENIQAYSLNDRTLVWCLALPHPANRQVGFKWQQAHEYIRTFRAIELPTILSK